MDLCDCALKWFGLERKQNSTAILISSILLEFIGDEWVGETVAWPVCHAGISPCPTIKAIMNVCRLQLCRHIQCQNLIKLHGAMVTKNVKALHAIDAACTLSCLYHEWNLHECEDFTVWQIPNFYFEYLLLILALRFNRISARMLFIIAIAPYCCKWCVRCMCVCAM